MPKKGEKRPLRPGEVSTEERKQQIKALLRTHEALSAQEIADELGLKKSTVQNLLGNIRAEGTEVFSVFKGRNVQFFTLDNSKEKAMERAVLELLAKPGLHKSREFYELVGWGNVAKYMRILKSKGHHIYYLRNHGYTSSMEELNSYEQGNRPVTLTPIEAEVLAILQQPGLHRFEEFKPCFITDHTNQHSLRSNIAQYVGMLKRKGYKIRNIRTLGYTMSESTKFDGLTAMPAKVLEAVESGYSDIPAITKIVFNSTPEMVEADRSNVRVLLSLLARKGRIKRIGHGRYGPIKEEQCA